MDAVGLGAEAEGGIIGEMAMINAATRSATARRVPPTPGSTTTRCTPAGQNGNARRRMTAARLTSWRGTSWVRSSTRTSGAIRAITPWQTPTKSSLRP